MTMREGTDIVGLAARRILRERTLRGRYFPHLDETAWLMLVDLLVHEGRKISVTSACLASFAPATTALRHVGELERLGLITRHADDCDRRRVWLHLTGKARAAFAEFFAEPPIPSVEAPRRPIADALGAAVPFHHSTASSTGERDNHEA